MLLENVTKQKDEWLYYDTLDTMNSSVKSDEDRYRIIHQHILKILPLRYQHGEKGTRAKKENAIMLEIYTVKGDIHKFIYLPKEQKGNIIKLRDILGGFVWKRKAKEILTRNFRIL